MALTAAWLPALVAPPPYPANCLRDWTVYSTEVTWALDLAVVVPAVVATGWLLHSEAVFGPLAVTAMLSLNVALGVALAAQGAAHLLVGVPVKPGEIIGMMASFTVMTTVAACLLIPLLRRLPASMDTTAAIRSRTARRCRESPGLATRVHRSHPAFMRPREVVDARCLPQPHVLGPRTACALSTSVEE